MIKVVPDRCQPWCYGKAECRLCLEACPVEGCISFEENTVSVNNDECMDCGICTTVCPTSALILEDLTDKELLNRLVDGHEKGSLFLTCSLGPDRKYALPSQPSSTQPQTIINLPCLAILKESHYAALTLKDSVDDIYLDLRPCEECSLNSGRPTIERTAAFAQSLLCSTALDERIKKVEGSSEDTDRGTGLFRRGKRKKEILITPGPEYSRREVFSFIREKAREKAVERVTGRSIERRKSLKVKGIPERRTILLEAFKELKGPQPAQIPEGGFPVHQLSVEDNCTMCLRCGIFCPTGALKRVDGDNEVRVDFNISSCMGCFQCREFCPVGAISYEEKVDLEPLFKGELRALMKKEKVICARCKKPYMPELAPEGCPNCLKKERLEERISSVLYGKNEEGETKSIH